MNVIYSTDENYAKICLTSIFSLLESNKDVEKLKIYIIDNRIENETKRRIKSIIHKYNREIYFLSCEEICKDLKKNNNFPVSAYARLFIQDYVKEDKIIYIDADTAIRKNIECLWKKDLKENLVAGVEDPLPGYLKETIQMDKEDRYINSGILVINLKKWREIDFKRKVLKYVENHNYNVVHHDQGVINGLCKGKILYLEPQFNLMPEMIMMTEKQLKKLYKLREFYTEEQLEIARKDPYIVHYISKFYNRPWFEECTHPYKSDFQKYYMDKLKSNPFNKKVKARKFVFDYFPFVVYNNMEKILDIKRKKSIKIRKENDKR